MTIAHPYQSTLYLLTTGLLMVLTLSHPSQLYAQNFQITLDAADDATLYESSKGNIANSKGQYIFIGKTNNGDLRRSLIRFNLGTEIPSDATIDSVFLFLSMNKTQNAVQDVRIYPVLGAWAEGSSDASANEGKGISAT